MRRCGILFSALALAIAAVSGQAIDYEDVPSSCETACAAVISRSDACEELEDDEDASDWVCVCAGQGMSTAVPECLSCVQGASVGGDEEDDGIGDVISGLGSCGFSSSAGSSAAGTSAQSSLGSGGGATQAVTVIPSVDTTFTAGPTTGGVEPQTTITVVAGGSGEISSTAAAASETSQDAEASPSITAGPSQATDTPPSDLEGSRLTVITRTLGSGDDAVVATLTSVVPGPIVTSNEVEQVQQLDNGSGGREAPFAAAVLGFLAAIL